MRSTSIKLVLSVIFASAVIFNSVLVLDDSIFKEKNLNVSIEEEYASHEDVKQKSSNIISNLEELYELKSKTDFRYIKKHITKDDKFSIESVEFIKDEVQQASKKNKVMVASLEDNESQDVAQSREALFNQVSRMDLRKKSALTVYEIDNIILKDSELYGLGKYYLWAEDNYGVNALFLISLSIHESGWGKSMIAKLKNNLFGMGAYDNSPFESAKMYNSKGESILDAGEHISKMYLKPDKVYDEEGKCVEGCYFNGYDIRSINKLYASDEDWFKKVAYTMVDLNRVVKEYQSVN